nr:cytochrome P450 93A3-like [Tanacetum cinerariifolium]
MCCIAAIERIRERLGESDGLTLGVPTPIRAYQDTADQDPSPSGAHLQHESLVTPMPKLAYKSFKPSNLGKAPLTFADLANRNSGDSEFITPQKKLFNSIDIIEKVVMQELNNLKRTPTAKKAEREKRVRTLMSMSNIFLITNNLIKPSSIQSRISNLQLVAMVDIYGYLIIFVISLTTIRFVQLFSSSSGIKSRLPPSPYALPIIGHLHLLAPIPHQALHKLSIKYGPIFRFFLGSVPCLAVSSPELAKEFLRTYEASYLDRPRNATTVYLTYGSKDFMFAPFGPYWKLMKKLVMSDLLNGKTLDLLLPLRQDETNWFLHSLSQKAKQGKAVDVKGELMKLTNNVISRMLMSERCSEDENEADDMRKLVPDISEITGKFNLADYIWFLKNLDLQGYGKRVKEIHRRFDQLIERIISEHEDERTKKGNNEVRDVLDILLNISEDETMEMKLTKENIKAFILNLFVAGTDTSALTIEWALAELINRPRIRKKAVEEIDQVVGKNRLLEESDIPNLPYLQAIVKEALRLHPTAPMILRTSTEDCTVGGYLIPAQTLVFVNVWALGRDPQNWDDPLEFSPERFEGSQVDVRGQHFHMLPFGSGRRMCPGTSLAMQVAQVTLGVMVQCFEWKAGEKGDMAQVDMEEGHGITLPRANPLICVPVARLDSIIPSM